MDIHNLLGIMLTNKYIKINISIYLKYEKSKWDQLCMRRLPPPPRRLHWHEFEISTLFNKNCFKTSSGYQNLLTRVVL